ncbi:uncharacterized protein LOC127358158 isoform X2 [Dicentrarchus labrax]|uniref:uncharacterized protein LOC127358158 isoform X2 n=1 Tax=Dicentrarchus labrax TaxID=13489 RepID=UPI0021F61A9D|nr:uncharacterized protein LOC127358158 isoform X2 [Dicentrarchus labrax]
MEDNILGCQVCLTKFKWISDFKKHARSTKHREKIKEIFQEDTFKGHGLFPYITVMDSRGKHDIKQPLIGLSLLTFCFSLETKIFFYLCHVCEEKCLPDRIARHLSSSDHCSNYFNYTDPNVLSLSWLPSMNMSVILRPELTKEAHERGPGQLQMLDLPGNMLKKLETSTYSEVMRTLSENEKLLKLIEAVKPKRMMIQTYQRDSNRKHPLLGLQHIVECVCVGLNEKRYYLCTLCKLTLAAHMVIKHVLSFDHIYCYFKAWHPSTLLSKECYKDYNKALTSMILDFAKQTEEIHGTANADMKQVSLEPAKFTSVNFTCYAEALKELESITKENKESSLITSIKPGKKLERLAVSALKELESITKENKESSLITSIKPEKKLERPAVSATSVAFLCKLCCQECNVIFETTAQYFKHVSQREHKEMLEKFFVKDESDDGCAQTVRKPRLGFFKYLKERSAQNQPAIGVSLVVTCVSTQVQVEPIYVCFACKDCFPDSVVRQHFNSRKHLINTMLYQNPWRLPFGWENRLDVKGLTAVAWREEEERRLNQMTLKILDIPYWMFAHLTSDYPKVMTLLQRHHTLLKRNVPQCETYSKLKENERFPLLGLQFLVMHDMVKQHQSLGVGFLCLLCKRRLSDEECHAHVFSREHVATFLDCFHPGSLNSSTDVETLLDLAKQAGRIHSISHVQVIKLDKKPIWEPCTYHKAISILASAKRREGKGKLKPPIMHKMKLVPRGTLKDVDKAHVSENSRVMEGSEKKTIQKSTEYSETSLTNTSVEDGVEIANTQCVENAENAGKEGDKKIPTPSPKESERRKEVFPKTSSEEIKNAVSETCRRIKQEKIVKEEDIEKPIVRTPSGETLESCKIADKTDGTEIGEERSKSSKDALTQLKNTACKENENKRSSSTCEKSQDDTCPNEEAEKEMCYKRQRLTFKQEASCEEPQNLPSSRQTEGVDKETPTPSPKESERGREVFPKTSSEEIKNADSETCQRIKEEKIEELIVRTPSGESLKSCKHTDKADGTEIGEERSKSSKGVLKQLKNNTYKENKRKRSSMCEKSQEVTCPNEDVEMGHKRQRLTFKQQASCEEPQNLPSSGQTEATTADEGESGKLSHKTAKDNVSPSLNQAQEQAAQLWQYVKRKSREPVVGLNALLECYCDQRGPIYLCECCSLKIPEKNIISHVTGAEHQKMYLVGLQKLPPPPGKHLKQNIRHLAALFEKANGYGEAQVVDLDERIYNDISKQNFESAIQTVKTLLTVQPVDTSVTHHAQQEVYSNTEDLQVGDKEVGDSDSEAQPSSVTAAVTVMTESACKTTEVPPESNEDAKMIKVSDLTANAYTYPTVSTSSEDPSSLHLCTGGTNTTRLHPDSRNDSKAKIISNSTVGPLKTITTSKIVGISQYGENTLKNSETASKTSTASQTMVTSVATKTIKTSVKCENTVKTSLMKHSVGPDTDAAPSVPKSNAPAAPHLTVFMSEKKNPPTEPSHNSKPSEVGLNQLIKVSCEGRRQVYCQLCSVRLEQSSHLFSQRHQYNYVKMKFPAWTAKPSENKLDKIVAHLAEAEKNTGSRCNQIEVTIDEYEELAAIPEVKALQKVKAMLRRRDLIRGVSSPTTTADERLALASPCEASSPDDAVRMEPPQGCADPLATDSESHRGSFVQTPHIHQKMAEKRHMQERSGPKLEDTQKVLEGTQRTSPVKFFNQDPRTAAALLNTKQQSQPRPTEKVEHVRKPLRCAPGAKHHCASHEVPTIGERTQDRSHLSFFLKVKRLNCKSVGLGFVWECHGEPPQKLFFLCESCRETITLSDICQHMVSNEHQRKYMLMQHPQYIKFWDEKDLLPQMKLEILNDVVPLLSEQESNNKIDAQVVKLRPHIHKYVETAPFSEALQLVQDIKKEPKRSVLCPPVSAEQQTDRQPEDQQSREESLRPENRSTQALRTDQRSDNEARKNKEKHNLEETAVAGDLDGVEQRRVLSALDVTSASSKADNRICPPHLAGTCHSPQETCRSLSMQPELRPPASQNQRSIPELQVKQGEVHSVSPSSSVVSPETSQTLSLSPRNSCPPTRKRPAVESLETLVRPCTSNPQPDEPLPAKCTRFSEKYISQPSTESTSESTPVNPAATSTLLAPKDTGPGTDEQDPSIVNQKKLEHLMALLREMKSDVNISAPDDAEATTSCADGRSETAKKQTRWDSKWQQVKATPKNNSPSTDSLEGMFSTTAAPENQLTTTHVNPAFSAASSSIEGYLARDNQAEAVSVSSASTADPNDPQQQRSVQSMFVNVSQFIPTSFHCVANNHNSGQIPQGNTDTDSPGGGQLPIDSIITARPELPNQQFMGGYNAQDHTEVNRGHQVAHSLPTVATASPSDSLAALGGYGQYSQMAYVTNGDVPGYLSSEAVGYTTQDNLSESYTKRVFYTSQIYPEQVNRFGHLATSMSSGWPEIQQQQQLMQRQLMQQQLMQQQLMQQQLMQQQLMQQQYSAWTSTALAAGGGKLTNEASYLAAALASIHCSSQQFN